MTLLTNAPKIPCRAKDPETCKYHGAERRAEAAFLAGDTDGFLRESALMMKYRNLDEVQAFITESAAARSAEATEHAHARAARAVARENLQQRLQEHINGKSYYSVGGIHADIRDEIITWERAAYQDAAIALITHAAKIRNGDSVTYVARWGDFETEFRRRQRASEDDASEAENLGAPADEWDKTHAGYQKAYDLLHDEFGTTKAVTIRPETAVSLTDALDALDNAFWR